MLPGVKLPVPTALPYEHPEQTTKGLRVELSDYVRTASR